MIDCGGNPCEEGMHLEEGILLSQLIQLRVSVQQACRYELIEDAHHQRWHDGKDDIIEGERPGFVDNLTREGVLKHVLEQSALAKEIGASNIPKIASNIA